MSHPLAARVDALREAGEVLRRRPFEETLDAACRVLDLWSDPGSTWRKRLEAELPERTGFHPATVREGLARALADGTLRRLQFYRAGGRVTIALVAFTADRAPPRALVADESPKAE